MAKASSIGNVGLVSTQLKRTVAMKYTVWDDFWLEVEKETATAVRTAAAQAVADYMARSTAVATSAAVHNLKRKYQGCFQASKVVVVRNLNRSKK
jgi:hypothetical protein